MFLDPHSPAAPVTAPRPICELIQADCFDVLEATPSGIVDLVVLDLPYACTRAAWDREIDPVRLWSDLRRVLTDTGTVLAFANQPFATRLAAPAVDLLKYNLIWSKARATQYMHVNNRPLPLHEDILVFSRGTAIHSTRSARRMTYNLPEGQSREPRRVRKKPSGIYTNSVTNIDKDYNAVVGAPTTILHYPKDSKLHPSAKPVELLKWLVHAYSNEGDLVLDPCMGSGSTGIAALELGRDFVGIESNTEFYGVAEQRLLRKTICSELAA